MNGKITWRRATWPALLLGIALVLAACSSGQEAPPAAARPVGEETPAGTGPAELPPTVETVKPPPPGPLRSYDPGDEMEVRWPWVQVRTKPEENAPAIALAYGNDVFEVTAVQGDWLQIRLRDKRTGWVPLASTLEKVHAENAGHN